MNKAATIIFLGPILALAATAWSAPLSSSSLSLPKGCSQFVLVTSGSWESSTGKLQTFEKDARTNRWRGWSAPSDVRLGKSGMAWGRGLSPTAGMPGPRKLEGDNRAPAGVFRLSFAFGYSARAPETRLRYLPITETTLCVDDPRSRYYNQMLDASKIEKRDWRSAENMKLRDVRYKWGVVVMHNTPPRLNAGSCIFLHVWKDADTVTTGCTAMPEATILSLIKWLDPARHPVLVQIPRDVYREVAKASNLPPI